MVNTRLVVITGVVLLLMSTLVSCTRTPTVPEPENELVIQLVLQAGNRWQAGALSRVMGADDHGNVYFSQGNVRVMASFGGSTRFEFLPRDTTLLDTRGVLVEENYNISTLNLPVVEDSTYELKVTHEEYPTVTGTTTVPSLSGVFFNEVDNIVEWNGEGAAVYELTIYKPVPGTIMQKVSSHLVWDRESYQVKPGQLDLTRAYFFQVAAYDSNYYRHTILRDEAAGVEGGRGLFGSKVIEGDWYRPGVQDGP